MVNITKFEIGSFEMKHLVVTAYRWDENLQRSVPVSVKVVEETEVFSTDEIVAILRYVAGLKK